ncbi:MAG: SMP-30/gluconolactonase/LRE family protein [Acidobacteriota bacterium]|nr:SMP-30/gluconolactonase/LRE family protein [Acidobacteriota bacterium]
MSGAPLVAEESSGSAAPVTVRTLAGPLNGAVGGVAVDRLGFVYVADFGETVWKISPWGEVEVFAEDLYAASGNGIDSEGRLLQSSFRAGTVHRIDRDGSKTLLARDLQGPVGVLEHADGSVYVCGCAGNVIYRLGAEGKMGEGEAEVFAEGDLFNCPNGITQDAQGNLYVANFSDGRVIRIDADGQAAVHATIPGGGNGHLVAVAGELFVTGFRANRIYRVTADGEVQPFAGTGTFGQQDGAAEEAQFATPNGIAYNPVRDALYVNDYLLTWPQRWSGRERPRSTVREILFPTLEEIFEAGFASGGEEGARAALRHHTQTRTGRPWQPVLNLFGYGLLRGDQVDRALAVFELNAELFPQSFNVWDSLAEAHRKAGHREKAIELYRKSLELNPQNNNARAMLEEMGQTANHPRR